MCASAKGPLKRDGARALLQLQCVVNHWTWTLVCLLHDALSQVAHQTVRLYHRYSNFPVGATGNSLTCLF